MKLKNLIKVIKENERLCIYKDNMLLFDKRRYDIECNNMYLNHKVKSIYFENNEVPGLVPTIKIILEKY